MSVNGIIVMNEYEGIAIYAGFSLIMFAFAMIWRFHRDKSRVEQRKGRSHD